MNKKIITAKSSFVLSINLNFQHNLFADTPACNNDLNSIR